MNPMLPSKLQSVFGPFLALIVMALFLTNCSGPTNTAKTSQSSTTRAKNNVSTTTQGSTLPFSTSPGSTTTAPSTLKGLTSQQIISLSLKAANKAGSVHYTVANTAGGTSTAQVGDAQVSSGIQTSSGGGQGTTTVRLANGNIYVIGDAAALSNYNGFNSSDAATYANKWIEYISSEPAYSAIAADLSLGSLLTTSLPSQGLSKPVKSVVNGQPVMEISGSLVTNTGSNQMMVNITVAISQVSPFFPIESVVSGSAGTTAGSTTVVFSNWGEQVNVPIPPNPVQCSIISSCGG
ncbi:MAG: hypothetical protein HKL80_09140 [Acidimicrobiales bacterium]|nr:hypothetical protein [Acidimicrobiales bacterium]